MQNNVHNLYPHMIIFLKSSFRPHSLTWVRVRAS